MCKFELIFCNYEKEIASIKYANLEKGAKSFEYYVNKIYDFPDFNNMKLIDNDNNNTVKVFYKC